jgi:hypothetical protein
MFKEMNLAELRSFYKSTKLSFSLEQQFVLDSLFADIFRRVKEIKFLIKELQKYEEPDYETATGPEEPKGL